jgi:hypothetical protein
MLMVPEFIEFIIEIENNADREATTKPEVSGNSLEVSYK